MSLIEAANLEIDSIQSELLAVNGNMVTPSSEDTLTNKTISGGNNSITDLPTSSLADGAVSTAKFAPSIINSQFSPAGSRFSTTSVGWFAIPNCSMKYTAGDTPETLHLTISVMASKVTSGNSEVGLYVDGVLWGTQIYYSSGLAWYRGTTPQPPLELAPNQTVTLALYVYNATTTSFSVVNETAKWMPQIIGFSTFRQT